MNKEQLLCNLKKVEDKILLLSKKYKQMGLDDNELTEYYSLLANNLQIKLRLADICFDEFILSPISKGKMAELKTKMYSTIGWDSSLLIFEEKMESIIEKYCKLNDKKSFNNLIEEYYVEILANFEDFYSDIHNKSYIENVAKLIDNDCTDYKETLITHIDSKFETLYLLLAEGEND